MKTLQSMLHKIQLEARAPFLNIGGGSASGNATGGGATNLWSGGQHAFMIIVLKLINVCVSAA